MNKTLTKAYLAITASGGMLLGSVTAAMAQGLATTCRVGQHLSNGQCIDDGDWAPTAGFFSSFKTLWSSILSFVMAIGLLLVFLYLVWGGIDWITSGGDKGKTEGARNKITAAVIGLIVLAASYAVLTIATGFLAGDLGFGDFLNQAGIQ